jgi:predicted DNA-binding protein
MASARKGIKHREKYPLLQITVSPELKELIEKAAKKDNRTLSNWVRVAIEEKIKSLMGEELIKSINEKEKESVEK